MNKSIMIAIVAILVIFIGGGIFFANQQSQKAEQVKMQQEAAMMQKDDPIMLQGETPEQEAMEKKDSEAMMGKTDDKMMKADSSRYVEYSKAVLDQSVDMRRVLYFYATWCPSCKAANEDFTANPNKIPKDVVVIRTNYNDPDTDQEEKELARKYGITYQHTFVQVDSAGKELTKWNGGDTDELITNIK